MAKPTVTQFRDHRRFEPFQQTPDTYVQEAIDQAWMIHKLNPLATLYLAAHFLAEDEDNLDHGGSEAVDLGSGTGVIRQDTQGSKNTSKAFPIHRFKEHERAYLTTNYGVRYLELARRAVFRRAVAFA